MMGSNAIDNETEEEDVFHTPTAHASFSFIPKKGGKYRKEEKI